MLIYFYCVYCLIICLRLSLLIWKLESIFRCTLYTFYTEALPFLNFWKLLLFKAPGFMFDISSDYVYLIIMILILICKFFVYRYGCKRYLVRNLAELGFKEPTPIQRQAIPVLLCVWNFVQSHLCYY